MNFRFVIHLTENTISKLQVEFFFFIRDMEMIFLHICCVVKDTSLIQIL